MKRGFILTCSIASIAGLALVGCQSTPTGTEAVSATAPAATSQHVSTLPEVASAPLRGVWVGTISETGGKNPAKAEWTMNADGKFTGSLSAPEGSGKSDHATIEGNVNGDSLDAVMVSGSSRMTLKGTVLVDPDKITGNITATNLDSSDANTTPLIIEMKKRPE